MGPLPCLLALAVLLALAAPAQAYTCSYSCTKTTSYKTDCGWWSRCTRYRSYATTCYKPCDPVHGKWSAWSSWKAGSCSVTCGSGTKTYTRTRSCSNPAPKYGGHQCSGASTDTRHASCVLAPCPVDGGWSGWSSWKAGACSVSCGGGARRLTRTRSCTSPAPAYGGRQCSGSSTETHQEPCNTHACPVDGGWTEWGQWAESGECSVTCGEGELTVRRERSCSNPAPAHGGRDCQGEVTQTDVRRCTRDPCPVDGGWSEWSEWERLGECSALCGGGKADRKRVRTCTSPAPQHGGRQCQGEPEEVELQAPCNQEACGERCAESGLEHGHQESRTLFYRCGEDEAAQLMTCPPLTEWSALTRQCEPVPCPIQEGLYHEYPWDCRRFVLCVWERPVAMSCPPGQRWDQAALTCVPGTCDVISVSA